MDYYSHKLDELSLQDTYENTDYQIADPEIHFLCGQNNQKLDQFLQTLGKRSWVFISAANPRSQQQSKSVNQWQNINLEIDITNANFVYVYAIGKAFDGTWPAEDSFMIFDIPLESAIALAEKYNQNAILVGAIGCKAKLIWTASD